MSKEHTLTELRKILQSLTSEETEVSHPLRRGVPRYVSEQPLIQPRVTPQPRVSLTNPEFVGQTLQRKDGTFSSIVIDRGRNFQPSNPTATPDLSVKGGAAVEKDMAVYGNLSIGNEIVSSSIRAPTGYDLCLQADPGQDIVLCGEQNNLYLGNIISDGYLNIPTIVAPPGQNLMIFTDEGQSMVLGSLNTAIEVSNVNAIDGDDLCLSAADGRYVKLCNGNDLDMMGGNIINVGEFIANTIKATSATFGISVFGGSGGNTFEIISGALPPGLVLNPNTGEITGVPTAAGVYTFELMVTDYVGGSSTAFQTLTTFVSMASLSFTPSSRQLSSPPVYRYNPPAHNAYLEAVSFQPRTTFSTRAALNLQVSTLQKDGDVSILFNSGVIASGGTGGFVYSVSSGSLPPGLSLNSSTGAVTGTPITQGIYQITFKVRDSSNNTDTGTARIRIAATPPTLNLAKFPPTAPVLRPFTSDTTGNIRIDPMIDAITGVTTPMIMSPTPGGTVIAGSNFDYDCVYEINNVLNLSVCETLTTGNLVTMGGGITTDMILSDVIVGETSPNTVTVAGIPIVNSQITMTGDVTGTHDVSVVSGLQTRPVSASAPAMSDVLRWNGSEWAPSVGGGGLPPLPNTQIFVGDVTNMAAAVPMTGDATIANTGALTIANTSVIPTNYGNATQVATFTVNSQGRLTSASNVSITGLTSAALTTTGVSPGTFANGTQVGQFTVDAQGRITNASNVSISGLSSAALTTTGVGAGMYGNANQVGQFTVDAQGRITSASNVTITGASPTGLAGGDLTGTFPNPNLMSSGVTVDQLTINNAPVAATDAVNKMYVDSSSSGLNVHDACFYATTTSLTATYANGAADASGGLGIGATLTNSGVMTAFSLDGSGTGMNPTIMIGDRILVKDQASSLQNGIYTVTTVGSGAVNWVLTRSTDTDNSVAGEFGPGDFSFITYGDTLAATGWTQTNAGTGTPTGTIRIGTDAVSFSQFSGAGTYTAGTGLNLVGTVFSNAGVLSTTGTVNEIDFSASTGAVTASLATNGVIAGTYGTSSSIPSIMVDTKGRISSASNVAVTGLTSAALTSTGVGAGMYGTSTQVGQFTVDAQGRITSAANVTITGAAPTGIAGGDLTGNFPMPDVATIQGIPVSLNDTTTDNFFIGSDTSAVTGIDNLAFGPRALNSLTTGNDNLAIGPSALENNTTGRWNTAIGSNALRTHVTGDNNLAIGHRALQNHVSGQDNIAIGYFSLINNTTGSFNTAIGIQSLFANTDGSNNVAVGTNALFQNVGSQNVAVGSDSMNDNTSFNNTAVGYRSLFTNTTGTQNIAIGAFANNNNMGGSMNIAIGNAFTQINEGIDNAIAIGMSVTAITSGTFISHRGPVSVPTAKLAGFIGNELIEMTDTGVTPSTYGTATQVPTFTVDVQGRIVSATNVAISAASGSPTGPAGGDLTGSTYPNPVLVNTGVIADTYGTATQVPSVSVDAKGRITGVTLTPIFGGLLPAVATPNNTNAMMAGVAVGEYYRSTLDPAIVYQRTA